MYFDSTHADNTVYIGTSKDDIPTNAVWCPDVTSGLAGGSILMYYMLGKVHW